MPPSSPQHCHPEKTKPGDTEGLHRGGLGSEVICNPTCCVQETRSLISGPQAEGA